jgi:MoaA/NifB/PqqE/SkfB family radical SAM enzyme
MCPRVALADKWPELDLPWEAFQRIATAFPWSRHVHLQGWGEPLLHPRLFDMIRVAKAAGCRVGLTTNGMRLSAEVARQLLDLDLDLIAVSIAGATRETHESIRVGSHLPLILENVDQLLSLRAARRAKMPKLELSYLRLTANMDELPKAVELAACLGADELYAINLDYVATPRQDDLRAFDCPALREHFDRLLTEAREAARRRDLAFRAYPLVSDEVAVCEANPARILFIAADGWVSPCSYMGLAGRSDVPRRFRGEPITVPRLRFGNVLDQGLMDIWKSPAYRAFRKQFAARRLGVASRAFRALTGGGECPEREMPPAPEACRTCYKLYGL